MTPEQFDREVRYQTAVALARQMLRAGIISQEDYDRAEALLAAKFLPVLGGEII